MPQIFPADFFCENIPKSHRIRILSPRHNKIHDDEPDQLNIKKQCSANLNKHLKPIIIKSNFTISNPPSTGSLLLNKLNSSENLHGSTSVSHSKGNGDLSFHYREDNKIISTDQIDKDDLIPELNLLQEFDQTACFKKLQYDGKTEDTEKNTVTDKNNLNCFDKAVGDLSFYTTRIVSRKSNEGKTGSKFTFHPEEIKLETIKRMEENLQNPKPKTYKNSPQRMNSVADSVGKLNPYKRNASSTKLTLLKKPSTTNCSRIILQNNQQKYQTRQDPFKNKIKFDFNADIDENKKIMTTRVKSASIKLPKIQIKKSNGPDIGGEVEKILNHASKMKDKEVQLKLDLLIKNIADIKNTIHQKEMVKVMTGRKKSNEVTNQRKLKSAMSTKRKLFA